jgi:hypothetical protein
MVDLMRTLEAPMGSGPRHYLSRRLQHYGIDTSHFREESLPERERRSFPEELLREAAARSNSIREMLEYMGLPPRDSPYGTSERSWTNPESTPRTLSEDGATARGLPFRAKTSHEPSPNHIPWPE